MVSVSDKDLPVLRKDPSNKLRGKRSSCTRTINTGEISDLRWLLWNIFLIAVKLNFHGVDKNSVPFLENIMIKKKSEQKVFEVESQIFAIFDNFVKVQL